jgi:hypothetical protein
MAARTLRPLILTTLLLVGNLAPACADPIPAPKEPLKDYHGLGFVQIEIPVSSGTSADGKKAQDVPFMTWFPFRQGYVRPDRMLMVMNVAGSIQAMLATADTEQIYSPSSGYVVRRTYKNLDPTQPSPMQSVQFSMATYARVLRELNSGKVQPAEDLDQLKTKLTERIEALRVLREKLAESKDADAIPKANAAAAEQARLRNDLQQIDIRRANPCMVVEFPNKDLIDGLFTRGLVGEESTDFLLKGKTKVWITEREGLPIKLETTGNDGRVAIFFCFTELRINQGLHPSELVLGAPPGTRLIAASADLRDKGWEEKMDKIIQQQVEAIEKERQDANPPRFPIKKKK